MAPSQLGFVAGLALGAVRCTAFDMCSPAVADSMKGDLNRMIEPARAELVDAWPSMVSDEKLDPLTAITNYNYDIWGSARTACDVVCGAQFAGCRSFKLNLRSAEVHGMSDLRWGEMKIQDLALSSADADELTQCGLTADASVDVGATLVADLDVGGLRVECKNWFGSWTELLWKGHGKCMARTGAANARVKLQGSTCKYPTSRDFVTVRDSDVESLDFNLRDFDCVFDGGSGIPYLPSIIDYFAPNLFEDIVKGLETPLADALDSALDKALPDAGLPDHCRAAETATDMLV